MADIRNREGTIMRCSNRPSKPILVEHKGHGHRMKTTLCYVKQLQKHWCVA
jgi:hypothetical protein